MVALKAGRLRPPRCTGKEQAAIIQPKKPALSGMRTLMISYRRFYCEQDQIAALVSISFLSMAVNSSSLIAPRSPFERERTETVELSISFSPIISI